MSAISLAWRTILSHYLPGLLAMPAILALGFVVAGYQPSATQLLQFASQNPVLSSFVLLVIPLLAGVLVDDIRACFENVNLHDKYLRHLKQLPEYQFRFFHDEYYYYVEFDGNAAIASFLSALGAGLYLVRFDGRQARGWIVLLIFTALGALLWLNWKGLRREFLRDLEVFTGCEPELRE